MSRPLQLGLAAGLAVVAGVTLILASLSGAGTERAAPAASGATAEAPALAGLPQRGFALGRPDAPVTLVDYLDLQCPACRMFDAQAMPTLLEYVRAGKLRIELRLATILGPESEMANRAAAAAAGQDRGFDFARAFYARQGAENSGYVTPDFVRAIGAHAGVDTRRLELDAAGSDARAAVARHTQEFQRLGLAGTPSFRIGRTGGPLVPLEVLSFAPSQFTARIDALAR